jgi:hypothetical protein
MSSSETPSATTPTVSAPQSPSASAEASPTPSPAPSAVSAQGLTLTEETYSKDGFSIKYPQLTGLADSAAQEKLNKLISDTALLDMNSGDCAVDYTDYELNYKVTLNSTAVLSMYFEGYANVSGAAHPYQFLRSITIDIGKQTAIPLASLLIISEGVVDVLLNGEISSMSYDMTAEYKESIKTYLTEMGSDFWLTELRNADTENSDTHSFLTEDALVVSVSVPHVMGDHVEIYLPFEKLHGYQTDNTIWRDIEK